MTKNWYVVEKAVLTSILLKFLKVSFSLVKYTSQTDKEFFDEIELFFAVAIFRLGKFAAISKSAATARHPNARYATAIGGLRAGHW